jgi:hypothetical protein
MVRCGIEHRDRIRRLNVLSDGYFPLRTQAMLEYLLRFVAGGIAVSAFAALGDALRPKSFAGLFGAAPSIALATLVITLSKDGPGFAAVEGRSMIVGACALAAYCWTVGLLLRKFLTPSWAAATLALVVWFALAFGASFVLFGRS